MTFLELFIRFVRETDATGSAPTTVVGQTGDRLQLLDWLNDAYKDIQGHQTNWLFMKTDFSFTTTASTREYSVSTIGLTDHERWKVDEFGDMRVYLTSTGSSGEQYLSYLPWEQYRRLYLFGSTRTTEGFPKFMSVHPDQSLDFYPVPDDTYTVVGEYYKAPTEFDITDSDTDTESPIFPSQFHMMIIWRALMFYGAFYAADEKYQHGQNEYKKLLRKMQFTQLPKITFGSPLV